jgi:hypothetical protein
MNMIEMDIYRAIDMAFAWFKERNPTLEAICDEETMNQWYDFVKWCYAQDCEDLELQDNDSFGFEITPLMKSALNEVAGWWCKYNVDHQQIAEDDFGKSCDNCDGTGYMDFEERCEDQCEQCIGTGKDPEDDTHWEFYYEAFSKISNSVDTSSFEKLSKIVL